MKRSLIILGMMIVILSGACGTESTPSSSQDAFESPVGLPNPASVYCEEQGYELEMRDEAGGQAGYCLFPDGSECEEWAFYRGECGQEWAKE